MIQIIPYNFLRGVTKENLHRREQNRADTFNYLFKVFLINVSKIHIRKLLVLFYRQAV